MSLYRYNLVTEDTLQTIDTIVDQLNLPDNVATCSKEIAAKFSTSQRGYDHRTAVATLVYTCCRLHDSYRPADTIADVILDDDTDRTHEDVRSNIIQLHKRVIRDRDLELGPLLPAETLPAFRQKIAVPDEIYERAEQLCDEMVDNPPFTGRNPSGLAAAAIRVAAHEQGIGRLGRDLLSEASGVSTFTVTASTQLIEEELLDGKRVVSKEN